jgi:hypothetical protein
MVVNEQEQNPLGDEVDKVICQIHENLVRFAELEAFDWLRCACGSRIETIGLSKSESPNRTLLILVGACIACGTLAIGRLPDPFGEVMHVKARPVEA